MAVAFDAVSESHTGETGSTSETSFTWSHNPVGTPAGVLVFVFTNEVEDDITTGVTYDGTSLAAVSGGFAQDVASENGSVKAYFLGSSVPTTDPSNIIVSRTNNSTPMYAVGFTVTASGDTETNGVIIEEDNQTPTEENVDDGSPGTNSLRFCGLHYGQAVVAAVGANTTAGHSIDWTDQSSNAAYETTAGQGSRPVGFAPGIIDDMAAVYLAIREIASNLDSLEKRRNVPGVGRPWMRMTHPVATPDQQWRMSVGLTYGGNALDAGFTGTGALTFGKLAISGTGSQGHTSTGALTFTKLAITGTGSQGHTSTGALTFDKLAIAGTGSQGHTSTGALNFTLLAISGAGDTSTGANFFTRNIMRDITQGITETVVLPLQS